MNEVTWNVHDKGRYSRNAQKEVGINLNNKKMKNILFVAILIIVAVSCSELTSVDLTDETQVFTSKSNNSDPSCSDPVYSEFSTIGEGHNYLLGEILKLGDETAQGIMIDNSLFYSKLVEMIYNLDKDRYSHQELSEAYSIIENYENLGVNFGRFNLSDSRILFENLAETNEISETLALKLNEFSEMIFGDEKPISEVFNKLDALDNNVTDYNDQCYVDAFQSTFRHSYILWSNKFDDDPSDDIQAMGWKDLVTVLADGAGGLMGLAAGPVAPAVSVVMATYSSGVWVAINIPIFVQ